jgi:hypothetical protein
MFNSAKIAIAATLVLGSASLALADDYTDLAADAIHANPQIAQQVAPREAVTTRPVTTRQVALPKSQGLISEQWMDRASQTVDGGY